MAIKINIAPLAGKKLLVAPLDWGLGHTTRCIPIINTLLKNDCDVWLAGEGHQEVLLRKEFPGLPFLPLKGYRINFSSGWTTTKLLLRIPKILASIKAENNWLNEQVHAYGFDYVISDNRYGLYHDKTHSVFITHQLTVKSPLGKWSEGILRHWNYQFINHFKECWVPDEEGVNTLAGKLSHPKILPSIPVKYIGVLSRFSSPFLEAGILKNHLLIILSGPEPQRTTFENIIVSQIAHYPGTATVVRGLPAAATIIPSANNIRFYNHLTTELMNEEMVKAEFIISRSGYSTIMDIATMKKKSILVPTPGQTEQEYLANYLFKKQFALCVNQNEFSLQKNIEEGRHFEYQF